MIYTNNTKKAISFMFEKHKDQVDKAGVPYIFHPWHIAELMPDETKTIVALLHDVLEDTNTTVEDLRKEGFSEEIISTLILITYDKSENYFEYIKRVSVNEIARTVKLADLYHNTDLTRLSVVTETDILRTEKYKKSIDYLENYI